MQRLGVMRVPLAQTGKPEWVAVGISRAWVLCPVG